MIQTIHPMDQARAGLYTTTIYPHHVSQIFKLAGVVISGRRETPTVELSHVYIRPMGFVIMYGVFDSYINK